LAIADNLLDAGVLQKELQLRESQEPDTVSTVVGSVQVTQIWEPNSQICSTLLLTPIKRSFFMSSVQPQCNRPDLPWEGRGASLDISGIRFSLYPMTDNYAQIILQAISNTDTTKVWSQTDAISTVYRGRLIHVFDCLGGLFVNAYRKNLHMALEAQASKGCPGDIDGDSHLSDDDVLLNYNRLAASDFPVKCKLALYPLGTESYIDIIADVFRQAQQLELEPKIIHYATRINGPVWKVLNYLQQVCSYTQDKASHYTLHCTLSTQRPTVE
jgi:uncharacterized protein YqgV (UPF0045/DUF77 family)